jgi:hypothetical protein
MSGTVLFLGAGATKSVQGPMTDEILPAMFSQHSQLSASDSSGRVASLVRFLQSEFHVTATLPKEQYPGLPLLMSLLDLSLDRREEFHPAWDVSAVSQVREAIELGIFDVLEETLVKFQTNNHYALLDKFFTPPADPQIISTNYDLVADAALMSLSVSRVPPGALPHYHCDIANITSEPDEPRFGSLLKLHGSLNWLFCRTCQRLVLGATDSTKYLTIFQKIATPDLRSSFTADGAPCEVCGHALRPLLVAPSHLKDYRNPHLSQVWYEAQRVLRQSDRVVFIGYSLPDDDVEVVYLLKRSLAHIKDPKQITVVEYCQANPAAGRDDHPVGRRYRTIFGDVDWSAAGLDAWLAGVAV